jgi:hypothetical protein
MKSQTVAAITQVLLLLKQAVALLEQARKPTGPAAGLSPKELARVQAQGEVAHEHREQKKKHGKILLKDSLRIRRRLFPNAIRSTANFFGDTQNSGALFYRPGARTGVPPHGNDTVELTFEGDRIAQLWEDLKATGAI